jgi:hypothetical protein|nr:MAG TPA: hypothetical protein [Caudoviricetes sp.]
MVAKKKLPTISFEGMEMLELILRPSSVKVTKTHEELLIDEVKRYVLQCAKAQLVVQ